MTRSRDTADQINRINSSAANATAITVDSSENVTLAGAITGTTASFTRLDINASNTKLKGDLLGNTDGAYDIGASGANRPRNLYLSNSISAADITTTGAGFFGGNVGIGEDQHAYKHLHKNTVVLHSQSTSYPLESIERRPSQASLIPESGDPSKDNLSGKQLHPHSSFSNKVSSNKKRRTA